MEDELEDRILYQTYVSHMRILSRFAVGFPLNGPLNYLLRICRVYLLRPEVLICGVILCLLLVYLQAVEVWSRGLMGRLQYSLSRQNNPNKNVFIITQSSAERQSWELKSSSSAAYAIQGRRPRMEDRFIINENINDTGVALFAIFDGHGGEFAANYAKEFLIQNLFNRVVDIKNIASGKSPKITLDPCQPNDSEKKDAEKPPASPLLTNRNKMKKTLSVAEDALNKSTNVTDPELLKKLDSLQRPITKEVRPCKPVGKSPVIPSESYLDGSGKIDYGKLLTDEVLAADRLLVEKAKKTIDVAGTTALIGILEGTRLVVANVGDSRGVMCDSKGNAIPLSFDHKPQQMRERKRIKEAGGFIEFNGVWRVAGILATSRAMGDYPLKDRKLVIADPDILTFELNDHKPLFIVLASDGLWDTFSNEEAVAFIKDRLDEPHYGAKSITLQSYYRGSVDNISVIVVIFKDNQLKVASFTK
ncbi:protein phosphatase 1L isoform X2 [Ctenocephalides felis]|uniref:protein phosphatase 1L isoform X2 n=1 Tax=Ctenocephalides felis TaxID=7515 RepID=UPI000E6E1815|nr:protein phosphatase 1L isoform X2 [Ctenocephalides felis]